MIVKIGHGTRLIGALTYNFQKVDKGLGQVLFAQNIRQSVNGGYSLMLSYRSFEPYLIANRNTEKPSLHISLNPDPKDNMDDNRFICMAMDYMQEMGYGNQPYIVFRHNDIERTHIHIVSINVNESGKKISDTYEHRRSMSACRKLEKKYGLRPPVKDEERVNPKLFKPVDCRQTHIKSQIAAVVRYLPQFYTYQSLGTYNALISLFNITVNEVSGELNGQTRQGLVYFATDSKGQKAGPPFKASLFGKSAGYRALLSHFEKSKIIMKDTQVRNTLRGAVEVAMYTSKDRAEFTAQLKDQGINVIVRSNSQGRIYGITFIDHTVRSVWNGSQLGRTTAANVFEQWWNNGIRPGNIEDKPRVQVPESESQKKITGQDSDESSPGTDKIPPGIIDILLPQGHGEDYEEEAFTRRMKKKKRKK
ncbi:conjugal transfer protein MobB [Flavobacterium sp. ST-75]|uniref:Conjugal transfer protein MobB n=1 Tax=Flavobacterium rhizophilum TaxID=3163296 RepID=A0ABW8Y9V7_9FLAO